MVLLAMTPAVAEVVQLYLDHAPDAQSLTDDPSLNAAAEGNPISHSQLIEISRYLNADAGKLYLAPTAGGRSRPSRLSDLLRGCSIYIQPRPPKPTQTPEYKKLMARLRRDEEERSYERMLNPTSSRDSQLFSSSAQPTRDGEDDEMTYSEVNRQMALIFNVLISVVCCSVAIWMAARHWSVPQRLALSMTGSLVVAVAEVVIYSGYLRRLSEAKAVEKKKVEVKEIAETWVIEPKQQVKLGQDQVRFRSKSARSKLVQI